MFLHESDITYRYVHLYIQHIYMAQMQHMYVYVSNKQMYIYNNIFKHIYMYVCIKLYIYICVLCIHTYIHTTYANIYKYIYTQITYIYILYIHIHIYVSCRGSVNLGLWCNSFISAPPHPPSQTLPTTRQRSRRRALPRATAKASR